MTRPCVDMSVYSAAKLADCLSHVVVSEVKGTPYKGREEADPQSPEDLLTDDFVLIQNPSDTMTDLIVEKPSTDRSVRSLELWFNWKPADEQDNVSKVVNVSTLGRKVQLVRRRPARIAVMMVGIPLPAVSGKWSMTFDVLRESFPVSACVTSCLMSFIRCPGTDGVTRSTPSAMYVWGDGEAELFIDPSREYAKRTFEAFDCIPQADGFYQFTAVFTRVNI